MFEVRKKLLTEKGAALHAKSLAGEKMEFTRFELGNGTYTGTETDEAIRKMTALKSAKNSYGINDIEIKNTQTCVLTLVATNKDVKAGYYVTELGIYAKGADGVEVLYYILVATNENPDWMSAYNSVAPSTLRYYNYISVGDASNVTISGGVSAVALKDDLDAAVERITQLENASALCIGIKRKCQADGTPQSDTKWTRWGQYTDAVVEYARGNEAVQNDLMEVYPYNALRPCNLPLAGDAAPVAYLGDADFDWYAETGDAAGTSVMLEIPTEWYAAHWFDTDASGQNWEYKCIADSPRYPNSVYVKEEMKRSDGTLTDYFYFPIFMGYKDSDGHYVSKAGVQGTYNLSVTNARTAVKTNGDNWQMLDVWAWEIVAFLCDIMSANEDCKAAYGTGVSSYYKTAKCTAAQTSANSIIVPTSSAANFAVGDIVSVGTGDWAQNIAATREITAIAAASTSGNSEITLSGTTFTTAVGNLMWREVHKNGKTIDMASPNGTAGANDGVHAVRTLYIENLYSAFHTGVDGINLKFNSDKMGLEMWACKDPSKYSDAYDGYECLDVVMPLSATATNNELSGYIKKMLFDEDNPLLEMPDTVGGGSNSYEAAYVWKNKNGQRPFFGGASRNGSGVSLRCRYCDGSFGRAARNYASRPLKR